MIIRIIIHIFFFLNISSCCQAQIQVGQDIEGREPNEEFGNSIGISDDGSVLVVGAPRYSGKLYQAGQVRVFSVVNGDWVQVGGDINGDKERDWFGIAVAISGDGSRIIAGGDTQNEVVKIFEFRDSVWQQVGQALEPGNVNQVAISHDGSVVALEPNHHGPHTLLETTRMFRLENHEWKQFDNEEVHSQRFGRSIDLSDDGLSIAIGSPDSDYVGGDGNNSSHARVLRFNGSNWIQLGEDIIGKSEAHAFGSSIALSGDGNRLAVGASGSSYYAERPCYVHVYQFSNGTWNLLGQEIEGFINEGFGHRVALSKNGDRLAVASPSNKACQVRIFDLIDGRWEQVGKAITGSRNVDFTGFSMGLSMDGKTIAAGSIRPTAGYAHIYDITDIGILDASLDDCKKADVAAEINIFPNPTFGILSISGVDLQELYDEKSIFLFDMLGRTIEGFEVKNGQLHMENIPAGAYFLKIEDKVEKLIKLGY